MQEAIMELLDLATAILAVIALIASLAFPLHRDDSADGENTKR
jgi:hypothetical protein